MGSAAEQECLRRPRGGSAALPIEPVELSRWLVGPHLGIRSKTVACAFAGSAERSRGHVGVLRWGASQPVGSTGAVGSLGVEPWTSHRGVPGRCTETPGDPYSKSGSVHVGCHEESWISTRMGCRERRRALSISATTTIRPSRHTGQQWMSMPASRRSFSDTVSFAGVGGSGAERRARQRAIFCLRERLASRP